MHSKAQNCNISSKPTPSETSCWKGKHHLMFSSSPVSDIATISRGESFTSLSLQLSMYTLYIIRLCRFKFKQLDVFTGTPTPSARSLTQLSSLANSARHPTFGAKMRMASAIKEGSHQNLGWNLKLEELMSFTNERECGNLTWFNGRLKWMGSSSISVIKWIQGWATSSHDMWPIFQGMTLPKTPWTLVSFRWGSGALSMRFEGQNPSMETLNPPMDIPKILRGG